MIFLIALAAGAILILRPKDLLTKIFRVEEIELLHRRNKKEIAESYTVKDWSRKTLWRISLYGLTGWCLAITVAPWFMPMTVAVSLATLGVVGWFAFSLRYWQKYRADVVPLYMALTRVSGSRWTPLDSPMRWVRMWPDEVRIRLPRDQHTTPAMVKQVNDLVMSRLRGQWTAKADIPGFLLTYSVSRPVPVSVGMTGPSVSASASHPARDMIDVQVIEGDDDGPW